MSIEHKTRKPEVFIKFIIFITDQSKILEMLFHKELDGIYQKQGQKTDKMFGLCKSIVKIQ